MNVYFIEDGDGWAVVDCGIGNLESRQIWTELLDGPLRGRPITRLIVTHNHPDHIGMAGWLCDRLDIDLWCGRETFLLTTSLANAPALLESTPYAQFYLENGMRPEIAEIISARGHDYQRMITKPPLMFTRIKQGQDLVIGGRKFKVLTGDGHAIEQVMLYLPEEDLFFAADQVIEKISPNVSIDPFEQSGNPLADFLTSLNQIKAGISENALVLPGHRLPFIGLHTRCDDLVSHHTDRCQIILSACAEVSLSANDLLPIMFPRELTPHETSFAFSETLAHVHYLVDRGDLEWTVDDKAHRAVRLADK